MPVRPSAQLQPLASRSLPTPSHFFETPLPFVLRFLALVLLSISCISAAQARVVNRTIDDRIGDSQTGLRPRYTPATGNVWKGESCSDCAIAFDVDRAFEGTYTAATYAPDSGDISITLQFEGIAVYVYFILSNFAGNGITAVTDASFILNGRDAFAFSHAPDVTTREPLYNQLVYSRTGIPNGNHTLLITTRGVNHNTFVSFDYAIYTHDDDPQETPTSLSSISESGSITETAASTSRSPTPSGDGSELGRGNSGEEEDDNTDSASPPLGAIIGGVVGGVALILAAIFAFVCIRRRRKKYATSSNFSSADPTEAPSMSTVNPFHLQASAHHLQHHPFSDSGTFYSQPSVNTLHRDQKKSAPHHGAIFHSPPQSPSHSMPPGPAGYYGASSSSGGASTSQYPDGMTPGLAPRSEIGSDTYSSAYGGIATTSQSSSQQQPPQSSLGLATSREAIQRARQEQLDRQLATVEQEMTDLGRDIKRGRSVRRTRMTVHNFEDRDHHRILGAANTDSSSDSPHPDQAGQMTIEDMRAQMRVMQQQIAMLRENQTSDWARGLTDDPPPNYALVAAGQPSLNSRPPLPPLPVQPPAGDHDPRT